MTMSSKNDKTARRVARKETMEKRDEIIDGYVEANQAKIMTACMTIMKKMPFLKRVPLAWVLLRGSKRK
jgi:hypothetical protein